MAIQKRAMEEGMPYQTLIASIIHKYASEAYMMLPPTTLRIQIAKVWLCDFSVIDK